MDFRPMLNSDRFAYFTDQEKEYLLTVYLPRRGSDFSHSNLLYILGAFSSQLEKPLFDVSSKDASLYTKFLIGNIEEKIWREQYALTVFNTLQNFYLFCYKQEKIKENPFGQISFPVHSIQEVDPKEFSSLYAVDRLFSVIQDMPLLYLAAALAFRMALTVNDLSGLRREQFVMEEETGMVYLNLERKYGRRQSRSCLFVPEDLHKILLESFRTIEPTSPYVFPSKRKAFMQRNTLQTNLQKAQMDVEGDNITFSDLRNLSIFLMLICSKSSGDVAAYAGLEGTWLTRYKSIPDEIRMDAARLVNIRLIDRT